MIENQPNMQEMGIDRLPSPEAIQSGFKQLAEKEYTETNKKVDESGIYLWEVTIPGDHDGEIIEYTYNRVDKTNFGEISFTVYEDGVPISGELISRYTNGVWETINDPEGYYDDKPKKTPKPIKPTETILELRESKGEIEALESLFEKFESTYSIEELLGLIKMNRKEAEAHPVREPARQDLTRIYELLRILKVETDITQEQHDRLFERYKILSKAVGRLTDKDTITH